MSGGPDDGPMAGGDGGLPDPCAPGGPGDASCPDMVNMDNMGTDDAGDGDFENDPNYYDLYLDDDYNDGDYGFYDDYDDGDYGFYDDYDIDAEYY